MSRAKRKRVQAMRRKQSRRSVKVLIGALFTPPIQTFFNTLAYEMAQNFITEKENPPDV